MLTESRLLVWGGDSNVIIRGFPDGVRWTFGRAIQRAERGRRHEKASPMKGRLRGVMEVAEDWRGDTYRLYYTLKCPGYIYILYCHKKKSKSGIGIPRHEEGLVHNRFRDALLDCQDRELESR